MSKWLEFTVRGTSRRHLQRLQEAIENDAEDQFEASFGHGRGKPKACGSLEVTTIRNSERT